MDRSYLLFVGSLSGLISVLAHTVFWSIVEYLRPRMESINSQIDIPDILLHVVYGTGIGLLFWLSWGLAAITDVAWWIRGCAFGGLSFLILSVPSVIGIVRVGQFDTKNAWAVTARLGTTSLLAALACAWSWQARM